MALAMTMYVQSGHSIWCQCHRYDEIISFQGVSSFVASCRWCRGTERGTELK